MSWYRTGTVTLTNGTPNVVGAGTAWLAAKAEAGDAITLQDGRDYEIQAVGSDTSITLTSAYLGASVVGAAYQIKPIATAARLIELSSQAGQLLQTFADVAQRAGVGRFAAGALVDNVLRPSLRGLIDDDTGVNLPGDNVIEQWQGGVKTASVAPDGTPSGTTWKKAPISDSQQTALDGKLPLIGGHLAGSITFDGDSTSIAQKGDIGAPSSLHWGARPSLLSLDANNEALEYSLFVAIHQGVRYLAALTVSEEGSTSGLIKARLYLGNAAPIVFDNSGAGTFPGGIFSQSSISVSSGPGQWFGFKSGAAASTYGAFYRGGTDAPLGYIGSDGGGAIGGGDGSTFVVRSTQNLCLAPDAGVVRPATDNTTALGNSNFRWLTAYLATNPVVTSDARAKLDPKPSLGLDFVLALQPVSYRIADAKVSVETVDDGYDEVQEPLYETRKVAGVEIVIVDGRPVQKAIEREERVPVVDLLPVTNEAGAPLLDAHGDPVMHPVPRMHIVRRPKTRQERKVSEGVRRHEGLFAQQVLAALESMGLTGADFAGLIRDEASDTWGLRYEQFIPALIASVQALHARIKALEGGRDAAA
ncbi:hypothetical protein [Paracidovorax wautersii]|uniref:Peptidase S74 domain-containing protein n=1 Tax=Paracidovorax wautersii TaxID=1177982 RepID=A0A1I2FHY9_9BURK|nr:hypothetical protein [Paracidovorax wautersii]SFF05104.1 hypothetical protein SAMN04489711_1113 [Paracidovorax wautersii]